MKSEKGFVHLLIICEIVILIVVVILGVVKQFGKTDEPVDYQANSQKIETESEEHRQIPPATETETETESEVEVEEDIVFSEEVTTLLESMTLEQKVAQLFVVTPETLTNTERVTIAGRGTRTALTNYPVGGMLYARANYQGSIQMNNLVNGAQEISYEVSGQYLFAATLVETETGSALAVSSTNDAEALIELIISDGDLSRLEDGAVELMPLLTQENITGEATEDLHCIMVQNVEEATQALQNGAELLCITEDFESIYSAVLEAINEGTIDAERIEQAVGLILTKKLAMIA